MIQKHINLFVEPTKSSRRGIEYLHKIRALALVITIISFVSLLVVFVFQATLASDISRTEREKEQLEEGITKELERQITSHLVGMRVEVIEAALTQDIEFASKEASLKRILNDNSINAKMTSLSIPTKKAFNMTLEFGSEADLLNFVKTAEEPEFADNFALVRISDFVVSKQATTSASLEQTTMTVTGELL